ncbi:hypothetical protein IE53DRAFT_205314 [Violaceomyces palustris]|uniref:Uncharacterized protein n=1 Tax=Violaceomyces palustris TaxID=1673888 RepID=A0ACD0NR12_9BASI|nr:hypothetical protein IE53DRAFT_205314 [Violaceomyces palustris]
MSIPIPSPPSFRTILLSPARLLFPCPPPPPPTLSGLNPFNQHGSPCTSFFFSFFSLLKSRVPFFRLCKMALSFVQPLFLHFSVPLRISPWSLSGDLNPSPTSPPQTPHSPKETQKNAVLIIFIKGKGTMSPVGQVNARNPIHGRSQQ